LRDLLEKTYGTISSDYEDDRKRSSKSAVEDKRAAIKRLIDRIPTAKHDLFAWRMDWDQVDKVHSLTK